MQAEIRIGKVSSIDYAAGMVRIVYHDRDDEVTRPIALLSFEYRMPEVDDQVLVVHLSNGTTAAFVVGRPWSNVNKPPEGFKGLFRKDLDRTAGRAMIRYDENSGQLLIVMPDTRIESPNVTIVGDLNVQGDIHVTGSLVCHRTITAEVDVVGGGISLKEHTHNCPHGTTSSPNS